MITLFGVQFSISTIALLVALFISGLSLAQLAIREFRIERLWFKNFGWEPEYLMVWVLGAFSFLVLFVAYLTIKHSIVG